MTNDTQAREAFEENMSQERPREGSPLEDYFEEKLKEHWPTWLAAWTASRSLPAAAAFLRANGYVVEEPRCDRCETCGTCGGVRFVYSGDWPPAPYTCPTCPTRSGTGARPAGEKP